jgi:4-aminobutyrate aminotransferase/(S)-3-amino-2-methylpropionate transaminase
MLAIELVEDPHAKAPATALAARIQEEALGRGLLLLRAGVNGNCIRVLVPLVISDGELAEALDLWEDALVASN